MPDQLITGIYECNPQCKCSERCMNRVVQHPLQMKLQLFKTVSKGWGLRCMHDVPKGSFICTYVGDLLTEEDANIAGDNYGDEYFAELDYIERVENIKEGYESGVSDIEDDDGDDDEYVATVDVSEEQRRTKYNTRQSKKKPEADPSRSDSDEEDTKRQLISFVPNANSVSIESNKKSKSVLKFYEKNEKVFVIDAKKQGNIARYFNVSELEMFLFVLILAIISFYSTRVHRIYSFKMFSLTHTIFDFHGWHFLLRLILVLAVN